VHGELTYVQYSASTLQAAQLLPDETTFEAPAQTRAQFSASILLTTIQEQAQQSEETE
jgi:hypothetical protein